MAPSPTDVLEALLVGVPQHKRAEAKKFWRQVAIGEVGECWLWTKGTNNKGYGQMRFRGKMRNTHVISFWLTNGRPPAKGSTLLHACDTPLCVNPGHLSEGTQVDNMQDMVTKGRHASQQKDACPTGHPYTPENTYYGTAGRQCRTCNRLRARERRQRGE